MTKKDYELIAQMFAVSRPIRAENEALLWEEMRGTMADLLAAENPAFHRGKFIVACSGRVTK